MRKKHYLRSIKVIAILLLIALTFTACHVAHDRSPELLSIRTHTDLQAAYLTDEYANVNLYAHGAEELSRPLPARILLSDEFISLEYSDNIRFEGAVTVNVTEGRAEIYNLKTDLPYYYHGIKANGEKGEIGGIIVENVLPRNLYIDGVTNARDLGGYATSNGKIKEGMIYRTAKLNKNKTDEPVPLITEKGIETMLNVLNVRTEIDLRKVDDNEIGSLSASVLGPSVKYVNCPMSYNTDMPVANSDSIRTIFSLLAKEESYPLFFHCSIGTDRTGFIAFLILSLLGAAQEDVYRDYLFSNFGDIGGERTTLNLLGFTAFISLQTGGNMLEKTENYLISLGVTMEEIQSIRRIMLE